MQAKRNPRSLSEREDRRIQRALLSLAIHQHPVPLAQDDLERKMGRGDAVERAVRDLTQAGLLHQEGATVLPTRAALHFDRLELS